MKQIKVIIVLMLTAVLSLVAQEIIIQENEMGFCSPEVIIETNVGGYTGSGYANPASGVGISLSWAIAVEAEGVYQLHWRYAIGGNPGARDARLVINGTVKVDTVFFPHTVSWDNWMLTDSLPVFLEHGHNQIRLEAYSSSGLANYDYFQVDGMGVAATNCTPFYTLSVGLNNAEWGQVSYEPIQDYYDAGDLITVHAVAEPGYFFQSWTGDVTAAQADFSFSIDQNVQMEALFLPAGTGMDAAATGYATVQDDAGTPYLIIGGALGDSVHVSSSEELAVNLAADEPRIISFDQEFSGTQEITIRSHKTLVGIGDGAHLRGISLSVNQARNVIIRNVTVSHVTPQDAIEINGGSQNIWIDHCNLYSDQNHGTEYYDGLLDIKNGSSFITVSWTRFHDHFKTILISSGDQQIADSTIRVTFHHNFFENCGSRLPSIRFGKAHIFNNYYVDCGTAVNSRMGACVLVERNYFNNVGTAVMMAYSLEPGGVELVDNHFGDSQYSISPACQMDPPYDYSLFLDPVEDLPDIMAVEWVGVDTGPAAPETFNLLCWPNPFNPTTTISYELPFISDLMLTIYDMLGREVISLANTHQPAGTYNIQWDGLDKSARPVNTGVYFCRLEAGDYSSTIKMVYLR